MTIEWTLNVGNMLTLVVLVGTLIGIYSKNEGRWKVSELQWNTVQTDVVDIKNDIKLLNATLIEIALQKKDIESLNTRFNTLDKRFDELRRGEGLIVHQPAFTEQRR